jgi:hypothetical protein
MAKKKQPKKTIHIKRDVNILKCATGELNLTPRTVQSKKNYKRTDYKRGIYD